MKKVFVFKAKVWIWQGDNPWYFISVDKKVSEKVKISQVGKLKRGFGAVRVKVNIGKSFWETSIFPDKRSGTYLLPLKAKIRKEENITYDDIVRINLELK